MTDPGTAFIHLLALSLQRDQQPIPSRKAEKAAEQARANAPEKRTK